MGQSNPRPLIASDASGTIADNTLRQFVGYHMKRAYDVLRSDLAKSLEPLGLRITTYSSLILIVDNPGIRQSQLANVLDIERPNMVLILDDLEQNGWITRQRVPADRRAYALTATPGGRRLCKKAVALDLQHESKFLHGLKAEDIGKLTGILNSIENAGRR